MDPATAYLASAGIMGVAGLAGGAMNSAAQAGANEKNLQMMRENNQNNAFWTEAAWTREDNAVRRRANDLKLAGMSPVLAAGQGASSSAPIKMEAGHVESTRPGDAVTNAAQGIIAASEVARTRANVANIDANTNYTKTQERAAMQSMGQELIMNGFKSGAISAETARAWQETARKRYELERDKQAGLGDRSTTPARLMQDVKSVAGKPFGFINRNPDNKVHMSPGVGSGEGLLMDGKGNVYDKNGKLLKKGG